MRVSDLVAKMIKDGASKEVILDTLRRKGRATCPTCHRRGVGYAAHPHAFGYKDYSRLVCRFCGARWRRRTTTTDGGA